MKVMTSHLALRLTGRVTAWLVGIGAGAAHRDVDKFKNKRRHVRCAPREGRLMRGENGGIDVLSTTSASSRSRAFWHRRR